MITCNELWAIIPSPHEPGCRPPVGPTDLRDPGGRAFVASWQAHVDAGRIGKSPSRPTAALLEAAPVDEEARETILANERLMLGRQRTIIG